MAATFGFEKKKKIYITVQRQEPLFSPFHHWSFLVFFLFCLFVWFCFFFVLHSLALSFLIAGINLLSVCNYSGSSTLAGLYKWNRAQTHSHTHTHIRCCCCCRVRVRAVLTAGTLLVSMWLVKCRPLIRLITRTVHVHRKVSIKHLYLGFCWWPDQACGRKRT